MIEMIQNIDNEMFIFINSHHTPFFDFFMFWLSDKKIWIPLYLFIIYSIYQFDKKYWWVSILLLIISIGLADFITSGIMKPFFQRLRPCHTNFYSYKVILNGKCGGKFGFASSHAANSFALFSSYFLCTKKHNPSKIIYYSLGILAFLVSISRVYNGVHFPSDILVGAIVGILISFFILFLFNQTFKT